MESNYPAGAATDKKAPFNQCVSHLCSVCDSIEAEDAASETYEPGSDQYDNLVDELLKDFGMCHECHLTNIGDD
jgi:hypothetical protein